MTHKPKKEQRSRDILKINKSEDDKQNKKQKDLESIVWRPYNIIVKVSLSVDILQKTGKQIQAAKV